MIRKIVLLLVLSLQFPFGNGLQAQVPSYIPTNGLVAWWPFNGDAKDESGNGHDGVIHNAAATTDRYGKIAKAFDFNKSYIEVQPIVEMNNAMDYTMSGWFLIRNYDPDTAQFLISRGRDSEDGLAVLIKYDQKLSSVMNGFWSFQQDSKAKVFPGKSWYNFVVSRQGAKVSLYINGELDTTAVYASPLASNSEKIHFGTHKWQGAQPNEFAYFFNGKLDDIAFWNRALSARKTLSIFKKITPFTSLFRNK